ncbi:MAG: aminopeptidase, partial [Planctomycetota bacterium]
YVIQQGWGQLSLAHRQVELDDPEVSEGLTDAQRANLEWVPKILEFGRQELDLTPGDSYTTFLDTEGKPISHIVIAAHPRALLQYQWCFPFVGCVAYKGYFDDEDAASLKSRLDEDGWDVALLPVGAYSTLGWFRDPVLSSMLDRSLPGLVELLLHEVVHRTIYYPNSTTVNESLATHVAREATKRFFEKHPDACTKEEWENYSKRHEMIDADRVLLERLRWDLARLYAEPLPDEEIDARKAELFEAAKHARSLLFGNSADLPASNAYVLSSSNYSKLIPVFARLQEDLGGEPRRLMAYLIEEKERTGSYPDAVRDALRPKSQ